MPAAEFAERVQRLHDARALGPAAAGAGGQRDDGRPRRRASPPRPARRSSARPTPAQRRPRRPARHPRYRCWRAAGSGPGRCGRLAGRRESARAARGRSRSRSSRRPASCRLAVVVFRAAGSKPLNSSRGAAVHSPVSVPASARRRTAASLRSRRSGEQVAGSGRSQPGDHQRVVAAGITAASPLSSSAHVPRSLIAKS